MNEREIFTNARAMHDAEEREAYLSQACGEDAAARKRIEGLLHQDAQDDSFLRLPTTRIGSEVVENDLVPPGSVIGPYKLLEQIGEGGFGIVYMAEQAKPIRRMVALKVIKPGMDSKQVIARFEAERQALAIMDHPCIAQVFDAGTTAETGRPYFVMELVKGVPITEFCDQNKFTPQQRLELFVPVCQAIQHAHSKGIIHRDIKPGNVLVAMYGDRPVPKVIDFGVAKATGQRLTEQTLHTGFGAVIGSVEYMSPEQASFNQLDVDIRSDVYSLGVLLYELLAGSPPHNRHELERVGLLESLRVIRESDPVPLSTRLSTAEGLPSLAACRATEPARLAALLKGELDWIVMKSLEKDRERRYETVNSFAADVQRYLYGKPVEAHPPGVIYRARKFAARNRVPVLASGVVIAVLLVAVGFAAHTLWQRDKRIDAHSDLVSAAIEDSSRVLGLAMAAPIGRNAEWAAARSSRSRIADLLQAAPADQATITRAQAYLAAFDDADSDRRLAEQIEDVVMMSATHEDVESWQHMDQQFRDLFRDRGINLETLPPMEVARRIRENRSADRLSEALELWIGTLGQLGAMGVKELTAETMQPWADAMFAADTDPVRTGIRRLIYDRKRPTPEDVEAVIAGVDLATLSPRTLSWLATTFQMAGDLDRCNEILLIAVDCYPSDFMLNHDVAYSLASQNNWSGVIRFYMRCTAIRPDVDGVWRGLGNAFRKNGELPRSLLALRKAISLAPEHAPTYVDLAMTQLSMCEYADAEASAQKANQLGSKTPQTYLLQGEALLHLNRVAEALVALQICQSLASEESEEALRAADLIIECRQLLGTGPQPDSNSETGTPPSGQTPTSPAQDE